jgi:Family of unknown function (DUF5709)
MSDNEDYDPDDLDEFQSEGQLDASDTLEGNPGDDPLDAGIIPTDHWSPAMRFGDTAQEQQEGESLDQLLSEERPDVLSELDDEDEEDEEDDSGDDEDAGDEDVDGLLLDDGPDPRSGRLVAEDEGAHSVDEDELVATDVGIDGGAASAEEAAVHTVDDDDTDIRSGD